nr:NADH dehydrogenase [ubiquinone] 1 beta subcomplex subunit 3 isoform X1 [Caretta caretta]
MWRPELDTILQLRLNQHGGEQKKYFSGLAHTTPANTSQNDMGHGHEHGHGKMELPDYKQWKIEGTPLQDVQEKLAKRGLRDPWIRNEAWRYMGGFAKPVTVMDVLTKGFKWGFVAFVVALGVEYTLFPPKKNGGHH